MKANMKSIPADKIIVRGVTLDFNGLNERHLRRWQDVGAVIEEKYPGAMDLSGDLDNITSYGEIAEKYELGTKAFCELFDGVFGAGSSEQLMGSEPYYGLCLEMYYEILAAIERQGQSYGQKVTSTLSRFAPVGPKGAKSPAS